MKKGTWGFTFIEIIVVTTIIGLLMSGAAVSYSVLTKNARDAKRKTDLEQMRSSLELYKSTYGVYPMFDVGGGPVAGWSTFDNTESQFKTFMSNTFPKDPKPPLTCDSYLYVMTDGTQKSYTIYTALENKNSIDATQAKSTPKDTPQGTNTNNITFTVEGASSMCSGTIFNYWLNSP